MGRRDLIEKLKIVIEPFAMRIEPFAMRINRDGLLPIIGPRVGPNLLVSPHGFADFVGYPLTTDRDNLAKITQYLSTQSDYINRYRLAETFLSFMKHKLFDYARAGLFRQYDVALLHAVEENFDELTFTEMVVQLMGDKLIEIQEIDVYQILAELPLALYVTTNYHTFLEAALRRVGKLPHPEICRWHEGLEDIPSVFDSAYKPTLEEPVVYHLHGLEEYPASLVLTEDDYMKFLIVLTENRDLVPTRIRAQLAETHIILLGYQFEDQDFRSIKDSLLTHRRDSSFPRLTGFVQFEMDSLQMEHAKTYMERSMERFGFKVYWGTPQQFMYELYLAWQKHSLGKDKDTSDDNIVGPSQTNMQDQGKLLID